MFKQFVNAGRIAVSMLVLSGMLVAVQPTFAQDDAPPPPDGERGERGESPLEDYRYLVDEAVADALGISVDELEAAKENGESIRDLAEAQNVDIETVREAAQAARAEMIAQALADGVITEEQAERLAEHKAGPRRGGKPNGGGLLSQYSDIMNEAVADALGISVDELEAAKENGESLRDLAEAQNIEIETVHEAVEAARTQVIEQALADGVITEEQAERLQERGSRPNGPRSGIRGEDSTDA